VGPVQLPYSFQVGSDNVTTTFSVINEIDPFGPAAQGFDTKGTGAGV
jgi:hypothetical protein